MRTALVTLTVCLFVLPAHAKYSGGSGTAADPYQIATAADLIALGETPSDYDKHFILTADINLDPNLPGRKVFAKAVIAPADTSRQDDYVGPVGTPFTGSFDGSSLTVSHLTVDGIEYLGLFGYLGAKAEIRNLGMMDAKVSGSKGRIGALAGYNLGAIVRCHSTGTIKGTDAVGGLIGLSGGTMDQCFSMGVVGGTLYVGGLVGETWGIVGQSYSSATVTGKDYVGGLVGYQDDATIHHCYATGAVSGTSRVGGLVGYGGQITQCYSTGKVTGTGWRVGGLVGNGDAAQSFWDIETSGQAVSTGGIGKSTAEMQDPNTFYLGGWAFVGKGGPHDIWAEPEGGGYPILWWQLSPLPPLPKFAGGNGERDDPYLVSTTAELNSIGHNPRLMKCHFKLVNDLNSGVGCPIGDRDFPYKAVFDGNGHVISNMDFFWGEGDVGLLGRLAPGAEVKDLGVVDVNMINPGDWAGALVGYNEGTVARCHSGGTISGGSGLVGCNTGTVSDCYNTGDVKGLSPVGGLVGWNDGTVIRSYKAGAVSGASGVGGLVGSNGGIVTQCHASGLVIGSGDFVGGLVGDNWGRVAVCFADSIVTGMTCVGGLAGYNGRNAFGFWPESGIANCHVTGIVAGSKSVGGLVGGNGWLSDNDARADDVGLVTNCYSTADVSGWAEVGGLIGDSYRGEITASFWDIQPSGQTKSAGGTGKSTAEMQTAQTFLAAGWDFVGETKNGTADLWWILEGKDYPRLWWEAHP